MSRRDQPTFDKQDVTLALMIVSSLNPDDYADLATKSLIYKAKHGVEKGGGEIVLR